MENTGIIQEFAAYLRNVKNRSELTISAYRADLDQFCRILGVEDFSEVTRRDVESRYISALVKDGLSPASRARKLSSLKAFFKWAKANEIVECNPVELIEPPKLPHKEPRAMSVQEVEDVMAAVRSDAVTEPIMFRDITIIQLLFGTGIRRAELANIKLEDIDLEDGAILITAAKGAKQRRVYYGNTTGAVLSEFLVSHRKLMKKAESSDYLLVSREDEKMSLAQINNVVRKHFEAAGLGDKGYTVHTARRTFASISYASTGDVLAVSRCLGHENVQTTLHYVASNEELKRRAACSVNF